MYERFYGLKEKAFNLTPDPEFLYLADQHKRAMEQVLYGIRRREGFTVLLGDVGTGKTTLCWALLGKLEGNVRSALVLNPLLTEEDMLRAIIQDFGVNPRLGGRRARHETPGDGYDPTWMNGLTRKELVDELNAFLLEGAEKDEFCVVIVDEAQDLSVEVLEQLRLLSNLETAKKKLLQVIFVGQPEFERKLEHPQLRSLNQRVSIRYRIRPLSKVDVQRYIEHRLRVAGATPRLLFTPAAFRAMYRYSRGYPRLVNLICDRTLLASSSEMEFRVGPRFVRKAAKGLRGERAIRGLRLPFRKAAVFAAALLLLVTLAIVMYAYNYGALRLGLDGAEAPASSEPVQAVQVMPAAPAPGAASAVSPSAPTASPPAPPPAVEPAPPAAAPSAPAMAVPAASTQIAGGYAVQVHSLANAEEAAKAVDSLQKNGYSAFAKQDGQWNVVFVGPFDSRANAEESQRRLRQRSSSQPLIRRLSN